MSHPPVSILMTTYNRYQYVGAAIESVLASAYSDFEFIIVDDCSSDGTIDVVNKYADLDSRIMVYTNDATLGDYPNRVQAVLHSNGKLLKFVDADDHLYPYGLGLFVEYLNHHTQSALAFSECHPDSSRPFPIELTPREAYARAYVVGEGIFGRSPLTTMIRRCAYTKVGGFTGTNQIGDCELWHLIAQKFRVVLIPGGLTWYREHQEQQSAQRRSNPMIPLQYLRLSRTMLQAVDCPLSSDETSYALRINLRAQFGMVLRCIKTHGPSKAMHLLRESDLVLGDVGRFHLVLRPGKPG